MDKDGRKIKKTESELEKAKKTNKYSSHSLRAGFVVSQYSAGKDLIEIQKDIQHSDLNQTNAYLVKAKRKRVAPSVTDIDIEKFNKLKELGVI